MTATVKIDFEGYYEYYTCANALYAVLLKERRKRGVNLSQPTMSGRMFVECILHVKKPYDIKIIKHVHCNTNAMYTPNVKRWVMILEHLNSCFLEQNTT